MIRKIYKPCYEMSKMYHGRKDEVNNLKEKKEHKKKKGILYVVGSVAVTAGMCLVMPKLIDKGAEYLYRKKQASRSESNENDDQDWGPDIVKKSELEEENDGRF